MFSFSFGLSTILASLFGIGGEDPTQCMDLQIPVVDMQDFQREDKREEFLDTLYNAMTTVGFFAVRNTGVDPQVVKKAYAHAQKFFKQEMSTKVKSFVKENGGQRGFVPGEKAKGNKVKDYKEFYHIGRELPLKERQALGLPKNIWPALPGFKVSMITLYQELDRYVVPLQEAIMATLNKHAKDTLPLSYFNETTKKGDTLLRALYYPALTSAEMREKTSWAAAHTDIDLLAILPYATAKGLQVQIDGKWFNVVVPEDTFVVNAGDMLENLTNGLFVSAKHRVVALEPDKERFSMVLFVHPTDETSLAPLASCIQATGGVQKYAPGTRKEFLWERLLELGIAPALLEPYAKTGHTERQIQFGRQSPQVVQLLIDNKLASPEVVEAAIR